nr:hypothetical protein [uncultured Oscillibacter sp.]
MKLKDCTKAELIFVIKRLQMYSLSDGHFIQLALRDVEEEREARRLREARQLSGLQNQKMQEYIALMRPYEGVPLKDIPEDVFAKADAVLREARAVDMKWRKLMGFPSADLARCGLEDRRGKG